MKSAFINILPKHPPLHVLPINDLKPHKEEGLGCPCNPQVKGDGQGFHNLSCHKEEIKEQPTTLEKDSCPYGTQTCRYNGNLCSLCRNEEPTTPETKVKISCPDCPHEETDAPEKKCSDESMVASGYIKTPTGWIAQGEATPAQMVYHVSYEVTCGRCEKSIKHSCGRV